MRENFVKSMKMQVEAQIHEESELWSTSQPFAKLGNRLPSQIEMQGRKPGEEIQQPVFSHGYAKILQSMQKFRGGVAARLSEGQISHIVQNCAHPAKPQEAAKEFCTPCEIFLCTNSVRFLSLDILCNFLLSPCNQSRYFLLYLFILCV